MGCLSDSFRSDERGDTATVTGGRTTALEKLAILETSACSPLDTVGTLLHAARPSEEPSPRTGHVD